MLIDENNSTTDHKCDCGKPKKEGNFECKNIFARPAQMVLFRKTAWNVW